MASISITAAQGDILVIGTLVTQPNRDKVFGSVEVAALNKKLVANGAPVLGSWSKHRCRCQCSAETGLSGLSLACQYFYAGGGATAAGT